MTARITVYLGPVGDTSRPVHAWNLPDDWVARADAAVLRERAQWLNWRAYVHAVDEQRPFTPYHAASRRKTHG